MSSIFRDNQGCTMVAGVAGQTKNVDFYDSVTGQQVTVTSFTLGAVHSDLSGNITASVVGGKAVITVNASGITGSTTPRWWTGTINGVTITTGANIYIVTKVTDTITAPCTLTQDYPTSSSVTDIHITGSGTVTGAGHKIDFTTNTLYGGIVVDANIKISGMGDSTNPVINIPVGHCAGDAHIILNDGVEFDNCGQVLHFENCTGAGAYVTVGKIVVDANSQVAMTSSLGGSTNQFYHRLDGNSQYPSSYSSGMVCLKSWLTLDSTSNVSVGGIFAGLRCGVTETGTCKWITVTDLYSHCTQTLLTWADVANFEFTSNVAPAVTGKVILRGGEWVGHALGDGSTVNGWILSESTSHYYLGANGGSTGTTIQNCLFLPGDEAVGVANAAGRIKIGGAKVVVDHCDFIGKLSDTYYAPAVSINSTVSDAIVKSSIFYKLQINRGAGVAGDPAIGPLDGSEGFVDITGSPPRPASAPNRLATGDYNGFSGCVSTGSDTYTNYGIGQGSGTPGAHDQTADPTFSGGSGAFSWGTWEADLIAGTKTIAQLYTAITDFYTPTNSAYQATGLDGADIGAVPLLGSITASYTATSFTKGSGCTLTVTLPVAANGVNTVTITTTDETIAFLDVANVTGSGSFMGDGSGGVIATLDSGQTSFQIPIASPSSSPGVGAPLISFSNSFGYGSPADQEIDVIGATLAQDGQTLSPGDSISGDYFGITPNSIAAPGTSFVDMGHGTWTAIIASNASAGSTNIVLVDGVTNYTAGTITVSAASGGGASIQQQQLVRRFHHAA